MQMWTIIVCAAVAVAGVSCYEIWPGKSNVKQPEDKIAFEDARLESSNIRAEWKDFKTRFSKGYSDHKEEAQRYLNFADNYAMVLKHNSEQDRGLHSYRMGINEYSDMSIAEVREKMLLVPTKVEAPPANNSAPPTFDDVATLPASFDWRTRGVITPVKQQGTCGSCYSFAAVGALEARWAWNSGHLVPLSEQNLVDCSGPYGNHGCSWGTAGNCFSYIIANKGINTESSYPYQGIVGTCRYNPANRGATMSSITWVTGGNEAYMKQMIATCCPVTVAVDASHSSFSHYSSGVYNEPSCSTTHTTHVMVIIGYGTQGGQDYWLVKNSWGTGWGEAGYIKMSRNRGNQCAIASYGAAPNL